jgi:hypothetical protein
MSLRDTFDLLTAALWFALSAVGIVLRVRRLVRLHRIRLPEPIDPKDREYLASVKRSTYLRLGVKVVFLIGALITLFNLPLWWAWRLGIVAALFFMIWETVSVDHVRDRLGRSAEAGA